MKKVVRIEGLDCANCAAKIERAVQALDGVQAANLSFLTGKLTLEVEEAKLASVLEGVKSAARRGEPDAVVKA